MSLLWFRHGIFSQISFYFLICFVNKCCIHVFQHHSCNFEDFKLINVGSHPLHFNRENNLLQL